jgi:type VI secretion system protein ImpF
MAPDEAPQLVPSVYDRLIDPDPSGERWRHYYSVEDLAAAVQRDVEDLLNTATSSRRIPRAFVRTRDSIAAYGLAEVIARRLSDSQEQLAFADKLKETIKQFEPRLADVTVEPVPSDEPVATVRFRIQAQVAGAGEDLTFATVLELTTGRWRPPRKERA